MDMQTTPKTMQKRLRELTDTLLDPQASGESLLTATRELTALFDRLSPLVRKDALKDPDSPTSLEQGVAVSIDCAARCVEEPLRVSRFLQGVERAIEAAGERFPGVPIHLLYAGTGPYATLVTPLLTRHTPDRLQVTLLDIHNESLDSLRAVLGALGLEGFVKDYLQADASRYRHPADDPIHIVVSETMAAGLAKEMQVPITLNLAPQLAEEGLWVPESIRVTAVAGRPEELLISVDRAAAPPYPPLRAARALGTLFRIGKEEARAWASMKGERSLPAQPLEIPADLERGSVTLMHTEITVFGDIRLTDRDCSLNHLLSPPGEASCAPGSRTPLRYRLGERPGLECVPGSAGVPLRSP